MNTTRGLLSWMTAVGLMLCTSVASAQTLKTPAGRTLHAENKTVVVNKNTKAVVKHSKQTTVIKTKSLNKGKVVIQPVKKPVVIAPVKGPVVITPTPHHRWYTPVVPNWRYWRGGKVVIVDNRHDHFPAFAVAMTALAVAIVVDQNNDPYTENGKPVIVKERTCGPSDEIEVIELDDEVLILNCR